MLSTLTKKNLSIKKLSDHHQVAKLCFQISKKAKILVKYAAKVREALETIFKDAEYNSDLETKKFWIRSDCAQTFFSKKLNLNLKLKKIPKSSEVRTRSPWILSQVLNLSAKRAIVNRRNFLVYNLVCPISQSFLRFIIISALI
jgi:hypothetical protein